MSRELNDRKMKILKFIIEEYITNAEPIGSRTISKNKELGISAATIRNEMSDLEDMGYLIQPHVSAGRVPSQKAYSFYVDEIVSDTLLDKSEQDFIKKTLQGNINQIQDLLDETAQLLSNLTKYTSIAIVNKKNIDKKYKITHFELVSINEHHIVMIMVMEDGKVDSKNIFIEKEIDKEKLQIISQNMREQIVGKNISELDDSFISYIKSEIMWYDELLSNMLENISSSVEKDMPFDIMLKGANNIFNYPEFNDVTTVRSFLSLLDNKDELMEILQNSTVTKDNVNIIIGDKSMGEVLDNCSIITANFEIGGKKLGQFGIIGPKRMDYAKAYSIMRYISKYLGDI